MRLLAGLLSVPLLSFSQHLTGEQVVARAIAYHDPQGHWETFNASLHMIMEIPNSEARYSQIHINLPREFFQVESSLRKVKKKS